MTILMALLAGLVCGAIAKLLMPGKDGGGIIVTMLLGIAGSLAAFYIGRTFGWYGKNETPGIIGSVLGAMAILAVYRVLRRRAT